MPSALLDEQYAEMMRKADALQKAPMMVRLALASELASTQLVFNRNVIAELQRLTLEVDALKARKG